VTYPLVGPEGPGEPVGHSYAGLFARADREALAETLAEARFSGWVGPQEGDWVLCVAERPTGPIAANGRDLVALAELVAGALTTVTLAVRVHQDRALHLTGWDATDPPRVLSLGRYVSDPTIEAPDDDELFAEPQGAENARSFVNACGATDPDDELNELLAETLDPESVFESERLAGVLRVLELPSWLVSAQSLPGDVPAGPRRTELTRLGAGRSGVGGLVTGALSRVVRRGRPRRGA
jgi:hypothetical protein